MLNLYMVLDINLGNGVKDEDGFYIFDVIGYKLIDLCSISYLNVSLEQYNLLYKDGQIYRVYKYLDDIRKVKVFSNDYLSVISSKDGIEFKDIPYKFVVEQSIESDEPIVIKPFVRYNSVFYNFSFCNVYCHLFVDSHMDSLVLYIDLITYSRYFDGYHICYDLVNGEVLGGEDCIELMSDTKVVLDRSLMKTNVHCNIGDSFYSYDYDNSKLLEIISNVYRYSIINDSIFAIDKLCIITSGCDGDIIIPNGFETVLIAIMDLGTEDYTSDINSIVFPPSVKRVITENAGLEVIKFYFSNKIPKDTLQSIFCSIYSEDEFGITDEFLKSHNIEMY